MKDKFLIYIKNLQNQITLKLEQTDGLAKFKEDIWIREEGGGGQTRILENGNIFEKAGVNISEVYGNLPQQMQEVFKVGEGDFFACGLSIVIHPKNPMVPTVHANWRFFEMYPSINLNSHNKDLSWFGGGQDLTPYYLFEDDAKYFHQICKNSCDSFNLEFYPKYKVACDKYFWNTHRNEARGIGGIFFDYCKENNKMSMENWFDLVSNIGNNFLKSYIPIVEKRKNIKFNKLQKTWQEIRRGRYVEFNLLHDKGTLFGLKTNGRIESILMSLPPKVQWIYDFKPKKGSEEEKLIAVLKNPINWII